jgi:peptidyl-prolyl cis-trans isomerase B (cyclophilin B)
MHQNAPHLDGEYAAFGLVTDGIEVVDAIADLPTDYQDCPRVNVVIEKIERA